MKPACLLLTLGVLFANPVFAQTTDSTNAPAASTTPATTTPPAAPAKPPTPPAPTGPLSADEQKELRKARTDAVKANPDLAAERKDLDTTNKEWQKKVDEAAAKLDPKVPELLARQNPGKQPKMDEKKPKESKEPKAPVAPAAPSTNAPTATPPAGA
jgi:hypothetical protein